MAVRRRGANADRPRHLISSRRRLVFTLLSAVLIVLLVTGVIAVTVVRNRLVDRLDRDLRATSGSVANLVTADQLRVLSRNPNLGTNSIATIVVGEDGRRVATIPAGTPEGRLPLPDLTNFTAADLEARRGRPFTRSAMGGSTVQYRVLVSRLDADNTLVVASPLTDVRDTAGLLALILLVSIVAALAVLSALIWSLTRAAIKPIDDMIDVAGAIGSGDMSARIDVRTTNAEVALLSNALNDMLSQLAGAFAERERSEARLRRFVGDASHELRTPLTTIQGWADLYQAGGSADPVTTDRAMDRIGHEAERMSQLVEDLLVLARLDQHRRVAAEPVDLRTVAAESVEDLRATQPQRRITTTLPEHPVVVTGDEAQLRQVVANLLANVRTHTDADAQVRVDLTLRHGDAVLTIADDGPGLSDDDAARVFDRFFRPEGSRSRTSGGSGLGLAIVRSVVEAHGGSVDLETAPGAGAAFTIRLPLAVPGDTAGSIGATPS